MRLCSAWAAVLLIAACGGGGGGSGPAHAPGTDEPVTFLYQELAGGEYVYGTAGDRDLRADGAYLWPANRVAVAAVDGHPFYALAKRRVQVHVLDVDPASSVRGQVVSSYPLAYEDGSASLRGVAATSYRDALGNLDGLFVVVDGAPPGIFAMDMQGEAADAGPGPATPVLGIDGVLDPSVLPAVEPGHVGGKDKILMAYAGIGPQGYQIRVGFLERTTGGSWLFSPTAWVRSSRFGAAADGIYQNLAAAFDVDRGEFGLAWLREDSSTDGRLWTAYMQRIDASGQPLSDAPFEAHVGVDALHSGSVLSYNRRAGRYLHQFQHNTAVPVPSGTGFACVRPGAACADTILDCIARGSVFASEVDYRDGVDFRMGGACTDGCAAGTAVSASLLSGHTGNSCSADWALEPEILAPARGPLDFNEVHNYVRAPQAGTTVVVHLWGRRTTELALLRASLLDEPTGFAFDE